MLLDPDLDLFNKPISEVVCRSSKSDLSSTTKCDQNHSSGIRDFGHTKAGAKHKLLINKPASYFLGLSQFVHYFGGGGGGNKG